MHSRGISHRDLKPENLIFESTAPLAEVMVADFGCSRTTSPGEAMRRINGTLWYMPPEVFTDAAYASREPEYTNKADLWSIGVMAFLLLTGRMPFGDGE